MIKPQLTCAHVGLLQDLRGGDGLAALPGQAACLVERMVQQNLLKDVAMDFRVGAWLPDGRACTDGHVAGWNSSLAVRPA